MTVRKKHRKGTRVVSSDRYELRAVSPKSGNVLALTPRGTFEREGPFRRFPTRPQANDYMRRLLRANPATRDYGMHVETVKQNPSPYQRAVESLTGEMDRAADAYENFKGRAPTHATHFKGGKFPVGFEMGRLVAVVYRANREGDPNGVIYEHKFQKSSQPLLIAKDDGSQLDIVGGQYQVTERGIEDR